MRDYWMRVCKAGAWRDYGCFNANSDDEARLTVARLRLADKVELRCGRSIVALRD
jgi:hypothetical protein